MQLVSKRLKQCTREMILRSYWNKRKISQFRKQIDNYSEKVTENIITENLNHIVSREIDSSTAKKEQELWERFNSKWRPSLASS